MQRFIYLFLDFTTTVDMCSIVAGIDEVQFECRKTNTIIFWRLQVRMKGNSGDEE